LSPLKEPEPIDDGLASLLVGTALGFALGLVLATVFWVWIV
jgi:hypothetical protein